MAILGTAGLYSTLIAQDTDDDPCAHWQRQIEAMQAQYDIAWLDHQALRNKDYGQAMLQNGLTVGIAVGTGASAASLLPTATLGAGPVFATGFVCGSVGGLVSGGINHWLALRRGQNRLERILEHIENLKAMRDFCYKVREVEELIDEYIRLRREQQQQTPPTNPQGSGSEQGSMQTDTNNMRYADAHLQYLQSMLSQAESDYESAQSDYNQMLSDHAMEEANEAMEEASIIAEYERQLAEYQAALQASAEWDASTQPDNSEEEEETDTPTPGLRPVNGSTYYANGGDTFELELTTSEAYSKVHWYVKPPGDTTHYGTEVELDLGDGTTTAATLSYTLPSGNGGNYRITAYIYYSDRIGEETYDVYVY